MAKEPVKKRSRKVARKARRGLRPASPPGQPGQSGQSGPGGPGGAMLPPPDWFDDPDGGAGVREPRHPRPVLPAGALELAEPESGYTLDLVSR